MSDLQIERGAKAIWENSVAGESKPWNSVGPMARERCRRMAQACIAAAKLPAPPPAECLGEHVVTIPHLGRVS